MLSVGFEGHEYICGGTDTALLGVGGGEKTRAVSGTRGGGATTGRVLALRYPASTACMCHDCVNMTAMSRVNMSRIVRVALEYEHILPVVIIVTLFLMFPTVAGGLPG